MACLRKRNGVYYLYWYEGKKLRGKRISSDRQTAKEYKSKFEVDLDRRGLNLSQKYTTWKDFVKEYLKYCEGNKAPRTVKRDKQTIYTFNDLMQITDMNQFTAQKLEEYKSFRSKQSKKPKTINRELNTLKNMGRKMKEWGFSTVHPVESVRKLIDPHKQTIRFLDKTEIEKLLPVTKGVWKTAALLGLYAGLRRGEVAHLTWEDFDSEKKTISVKPKDGWNPKDYEQRTILLNPVLFDHLIKMKKNLKNGSINILSYENGELVTEDVLTSYFKKLIKKADLKNASFQTLRRTFGSHLTMLSKDLYAVSKLLGHSSVKTTEEYYAGLLPNYLKNTVAQLSYE